MAELAKESGYRVLRKLAEGEFAEIFLVERDGNTYALKKLRRYLKFDREYLSLLENEARLLSILSDRDHFPEFFAQGECAGEKFLIMERLDGIDLEKSVSSLEGIPEPPIAARIFLEILAGLASLHRLPCEGGQPTVHGDLRPSNVMVTRSGQVKLIDLGQKGGTFIYMPFKRMHGGAFGAETDIYAAGHLFYELTHGERLSKAVNKRDTYFEMRERRLSLESFHPRLPPAWRRLLLDLLQQESEPRFATVAGVLEAAGAAMPSETIATREQVGNWVNQRG